MAKYICIGKYQGAHGQLLPCTNTSEVPTNPDRPEWGFLCSDCANSKPNRRPILEVEQPEVDKPNFEPTDSYYNMAEVENDESIDFEPLEL